MDLRRMQRPRHSRSPRHMRRPSATFFVSPVSRPFATLLALVLLVFGGLAVQGSPAGAEAAPVTSTTAPADATSATPSAAPAAGADTADEAVRTVSARVLLPTHGGEPHPVALPWATAPEPWYVLAAGGPPGAREPDRAAVPLVRMAPRADRAPPVSPTGI
ncbi:hypothetical protein [Yinghuangia sp. YIM S09857]|uniref:hypothetical protein n=1 Tax=Yinghuangia sp. YIM S09857 TaxID=3436929 RepID=UPI003F52D7BE